MNRDIPQALLNRLIQIGREDKFADLQTIGDEFPAARRGNFMRLRPEEWVQVARGLTEDEAVSLIKSLTKLEHYPNFKAGSVSPVIWIFRNLPGAQQRLDLINWVLANTDNDYLPFGSSNHGAKTLDEYHRLCSYVAARSAARNKAELDRQAEAKTQKAAEASQRLFGAVRRKDEKAIKALLARGANSSALDASGQSALQVAVAVGLGHLFDTKEPQQDTPADAKKPRRRAFRSWGLRRHEARC